MALEAEFSTRKWRSSVGTSAILFIVGTIIYLGAINTFAQEIEARWTNGAPTIVAQRDYVGDVPKDSSCIQETFSSRVIRVRGITHPLNACVSKKGNLQLAYFNHAGAYGRIAVSFGHDTQMYPVNDSGRCGGPSATQGACEYIPHLDRLIIKGNTAQQGRLMILDNAASRFHRVANPQTGLTMHYVLDKSDPEYDFIDQLGNAHTVSSVAVSQNGKWAAAFVRGNGVVLINLETFETRALFTAGVGTNEYGMAEWNIADDGAAIIAAVSWYGYTSKIVVDVTSDCGQTTPVPTSGTIRQLLVGVEQCEQNNLRTYTSEYISIEHGFADAWFAGGDSSRISFHVAHVADYQQKREYDLYIPNRTPPTGLAYLALGDSISSGEGDTEVNPATNQKYSSRLLIMKLMTNTTYHEKNAILVRVPIQTT